jgi:hypothetical protein
VSTPNGKIDVAGLAKKIKIKESEMCPLPTEK